MNIQTEKYQQVQEISTVKPIIYANTCNSISLIKDHLVFASWSGQGTFFLNLKINVVIKSFHEVIDKTRESKLRTDCACGLRFSSYFYMN